MENIKTIVSIFLILILIQLVICPVSAVTISFLDNAYMQGNDYVITDNTGSTVANFTGSSSVVLNQGKSYSVQFSPKGLFDISKERPTDFGSLSLLVTFVKTYFAGLIIVFGTLSVVILSRHA